MTWFRLSIGWACYALIGLSSLLLAQERTADGVWMQVIPVLEFKRAGLEDPTKLEAVRRTGTLRGLAKGEAGEPAKGWYEYEVVVPKSGWYELIVPGGADRMV